MLKKFSTASNIAAVLSEPEALPDDVMYSKLMMECKLAPKLMEDGVERLHAVSTPRKKPSKAEQKDLFKRLSSRSNAFGDSMRALLVPMTPHSRPLSAHVRLKRTSRPSSPYKGYTARTNLTEKPEATVWTMARNLISKNRQDS